MNFRILVLGLILTSLSGCYSESKVAQSLDACSLLTQSEVEAAIGEAVSKTDRGGTADGASYCHWYGNDSTLLTKGITLMAAPSLGKERYDSMKSMMSDAVSVPGIGDGAFTSKGDDTGVTLYKGAVFLQVTSLYTSTGIDVSTCKALAEKALTRASSSK